MDSSKDLILIDTTDSYFLFADKHFVLFGNFLSDLLGELFFIRSEKERVIFEIINDSGLPKVIVSGGFEFIGKENKNSGKLEGDSAGLAMTYFLQRHLVELLSSSKDFTNTDYLDELIVNSSYLKTRSSKGLSEDEEYQLYKFWD